MATGYNILQPNGTVKKVKASCLDERIQIVKDLLNEWAWYCEKNWVGITSSNPYSPENKVKMFLSSLGYFLIMGSADDIVTDYKQIMNGKREIPVSSCPSFVEDTVYSGVHVNRNDMLMKAEDDCFRGMMEYADNKAEKRYGVKPRKKKTSRTKLDRSMSIRRDNGVKELISAVVDTENAFSFLGNRYRIIPEQYDKYSPKKTKAGELYDMDTVYCAVAASGAVQFYDAELERIPDDAIECQ